MSESCARTSAACTSLGGGRCPRPTVRQIASSRVGRFSVAESHDVYPVASRHRAGRLRFHIEIVRAVRDDERILSFQCRCDRADPDAVFPSATRGKPTQVGYGERRKRKGVAGGRLFYADEVGAGNKQAEADNLAVRIEACCHDPLHGHPRIDISTHPVGRILG